MTHIVTSSMGTKLGLKVQSQMKIPIEHTFLMEVNLHKVQGIDKEGNASIVASSIGAGFKDVTFLSCSDESINPYFVKA